MIAGSKVNNGYDIILKDALKLNKTKHNSFRQKRPVVEGGGVHCQVSLRSSCMLTFIVTAAN